eukprot:s5147_g2.t2
MDELRHSWLEATSAVALRPCIELNTKTLQQIQLDLTRPRDDVSPRPFDEAAVNSRRQKVEALLIKWLQSHEDVEYMQGMHHLMAMSYRQVETDDGAMQVFNHMMGQAVQGTSQQLQSLIREENLFHADGLKLWEAVQGTSQQLQSLIREVCPETAKKLKDADTTCVSQTMFERPRGIEIYARDDMAGMAGAHVKLTFGPMLFQGSCEEAAVNSRRQKVEALLVKWLQSHEDTAYMQGMHHLRCG